MSELRAILFDVDDTLFSTTEFARRARLNAERPQAAPVLPRLHDVPPESRRRTTRTARQRTGFSFFISSLPAFIPSTSPWTVLVRKCMPPAMRASWMVFSMSWVDS